MKLINLLLNIETSYSKGKKAEKKAIAFLKKQNWQILEKNYKTPLGEIDIIAKKESIIIACEVKYRKETEILPYVLSEKQKKRIFNALLVFINNNHYSNIQYRFDVLLIDNLKNITHIENAFVVNNYYV